MRIHNIDPSNWYAEAWALLKLYLPYGCSSIRCAKEVDCQGMLKLFQNCSHFYDLLSNPNLIETLLDGRNDLMHSGTMEVEDKYLQDLLGNVLLFLNKLDVLKEDQRLKKSNAVTQITELRDNQLHISLNEETEMVALSARYRDEQQDFKTKAHEQNEVQAKLVSLEKENGGDEIEIELLRNELRRLEEILKQDMESRKTFEKFLEDNNLVEKVSNLEQVSLEHSHQITELTRKYEYLLNSRSEETRVIGALIIIVRYLLSQVPQKTGPEVVVKAKISGDDIDKAEAILVQYHQSVMDNNQEASDDVSGLSEVIDTFKQHDVDFTKSTKGSVLLHFQCNNLQGLIALLAQFRDSNNQIAMVRIETVLKTVYRINSRVDLQLTQDSLKDLIRWTVEQYCRVSGPGSETATPQQQISYGLAKTFEQNKSNDKRGNGNYDVEKPRDNSMSKEDLKTRGGKQNEAAQMEEIQSVTLGALVVDTASLQVQSLEVLYMREEDTARKQHPRSKNLDTEEVMNIQSAQHGFASSGESEMKEDTSTERKISTLKELSNDENFPTEFKKIIGKLEKFKVNLSESIPKTDVPGGMARTYDTWLDAYMKELVKILGDVRIVCPMRSHKEIPSLNLEKMLEDIVETLFHTSLMLISCFLENDINPKCERFGVDPKHFKKQMENQTTRMFFIEINSIKTMKYQMTNESLENLLLRMTDILEEISTQNEALTNRAVASLIRKLLTTSLKWFTSRREKRGEPDRISKRKRNLECTPETDTHELHSYHCKKRKVEEQTRK